MFGAKKRETERDIRYGKQLKLKEYNMSSDYPSDQFLSYIEEYESLCDKSFDSKEEEITDLLKLIAKQNLLILAELKNIWQEIPEAE